MPRVVHFEIHTDNPQRAQEFYVELFGWKFEQFGPPELGYWSITTGDAPEEGINGGLVTRKGPAPDTGPSPVNAFIGTVKVEDLAATLAKVEFLGGRVVVPSTAIPNVGWLAYMRDKEGNIVGLSQMDSTVIAGHGGTSRKMTEK